MPVLGVNCPSCLPPFSLWPALVRLEQGGGEVIRSPIAPGPLWPGFTTRMVEYPKVTHAPDSHWQGGGNKADGVVSTGHSSPAFRSGLAPSSPPVGGWMMN